MEINKNIKISALFLLLLCFQQSHAGDDGNWQADWITDRHNQSESNTWICFRKDFEVERVDKTAIAKIAADSKYWLWINGKQVVFEGGLKREGPNANDTYYDELDISSYLKAGKNNISILLWYFGKDGFSHKSSGKAALLVECITPHVKLLSNATWKTSIHPAFETAAGEKPNFRLSESNIRFDARKIIGEWYQADYKDEFKLFSPAIVLGKPPMSPWHRLVKRPIPFWKDYGLKEYVSITKKEGVDFDTLVCKLPYNAQITPWFKLNTEAGKTISIRTSNYMGGGTPNVRAEYVTKSGTQVYESLGWMNGESVYYIVPKDVQLEAVKYRETGYNTEFVGDFSSDNLFLNKLWEKSRRTLYVNMRDNFMDCPDRERAQWWGDLVIQSGQVFYTFNNEASQLIQKAMNELIDWQRDDGILFSPIPAGNWDKELPDQMLASVGYFGFWNYYLNTNDIETIARVYNGVKAYLDVWQLSNDGILVERRGDWYWGDWGSKIDKQLLFNAWYYSALKGFKNMSEALGKSEEAALTQLKMDAFKKAFNTVLWDGKGYKTNDYKDGYDDRGQALAVVSGLADASKYPQLLSEIFKENYFSSSYMEKYVIEALFVMEEPEFAMERMESRYKTMVNDVNYSTLWEGWKIDDATYGGGTTNHAWSGGGLTLMFQYIAGISPLEPGFKKIQIKPHLANLKRVSTKFSTVNGDISLNIKKEPSSFNMEVTIPEGVTSSLVYLPKQYKNIKINGKTISRESLLKNNDNYLGVSLLAGTYTILAVK